MNCDQLHDQGPCADCLAAIRAEARAFYGQPMRRKAIPDNKPTNRQVPGRWAGPRRPKQLPDTPSAPAGPITDLTGAYGVDSPTNRKDRSGDT